MAVISQEEVSKRKFRRDVRYELDCRGMTQLELSQMIGEREDETSKAVNGRLENRFVNIRNKISKLLNITEM